MGQALQRRPCEAKSLNGEVGEGIVSGQGQKISWQVAVDIPDLYGTNFVFESKLDQREDYKMIKV